MNENKCSSCGETKCSCKNKDFTKAVIEIDNPEQITLMRKVVIPASMGDDTTVPPVIGKYHNVLLNYESNNHTYLYSSDGIPTLLTPDVLQNLVIHLPNGMTTYTNNDAPIPIPEVLEAFKRGQSVFLVDDALFETVYTVTAVDMDDGIYSMRADQTGINPRRSDGHWHINGGGEVWDNVAFINDATPSTYSPNIYNKTWFAFTGSTPLLDQSRRTYYPASSDMVFNNNQENLSVAELWEKLSSSSWDGNPVILQIPLQEIKNRTTSLVDTGFSAGDPPVTISVSLGPDNYFNHEAAGYTFSGWVADCPIVTFSGREVYTAGIVKVTGDGNTTYSFVVSLTEVEDFS